MNSVFDNHVESSEKLIEQVLAYIDEYSMHQMSIDSILKFCPLSRSHFHASFKKVTGMSFINYLVLIGVIPNWTRPSTFLYGCWEIFWRCNP